MAGIKDRLIQFILRGKDELSPAAKTSAEALDAVSQEAARLGQALDDAKGAQGLGKALERTGRDVALAQRTLSQAEQQVVDLREALNKEPEAAGLQQSLKDAERAAGRARRQLNALDVELADAEQAAKAAGIDVHNLGDEQQRLAAEVSRAQQALAANNQELKEAQRAHAAAARSAAEHTSRVDAARGALASGAKQVLGFAAAFVGLNALLDLGRRGIDLVRAGIVTMLQTGDQFEGLQTRMNALMGSLAAGEAATAWIKDFARTTPLELTDVTEAFAQLKAYGVDPMNGTLQALVDQNEKLGGGMERLQGIISAVGQAYAKQKLQTEEILQLVERGVPVWDLLSKVTGKNTAELQDLASKGKLGRDVLAALVKEIGNLSAGSAEANMGRLSGIISNLKDQVTDFYDRISKAGALEYVKGELKQLSDRISQMAADGSLDKLAKGLSDAFIQGAEKVKELARELLAVDFKKLTADSSAWLKGFGQAIDDVSMRVQLFVAPFRTMFNGLTAGLSLIAGSMLKPLRMVMDAIALVADALPDMLGGPKIRSAVNAARETLNGLSAGLAQQIEQDGQDIRDAWDTTSQHAVDSQQKVVDAASEAAAERAALDQALTEQEVANRERAKAAAIDAAASGRQAIEGMAQALQLLDSASTVQQLESLRGALLSAFQAGKIGQQEYAQASALLNDKLRTLKGGAEGAADGLSDLSDGFDDLQSILGDVRSAMNEVDFNRLRQGIRKAYTDGKISADEFAQAQKALNERITELKPAADAGARSVRDMGGEVEAGASQAASGFRSVGDAAEAAGAQADFFGQVLTQAREPLAAMSEEALKAFDALQGITSTDWGIDTSSAERTAEALEEVTRKAAELRSQLDLAGSRADGFEQWMAQTLIRSRQVQASYLEQKLSLQRLLEGYEDGSRSLPEFIASAKSAQQSMKLLDESDLSQLESAIASAEQRMQQLGDASRNTLDGLRDELDRLQGNEEDIERRRYASRLRDLQAQLAEAQGAGDAVSVANLTQSLSVLRQIQTATEEQRARQNLEKQSQGAGGAAPQPAAQQPARVIRLETPRGRAVEVSVADAASETGLLDILAEAGLRTL